MRAILIAALAGSLAGCAGNNYQSTLSLDPDVDPAPWEFAASQWRAASGGEVDVRVVSELGDVRVSMGDFTPSAWCAETFHDEGRIVMQRDLAGCYAEGMPTNVATHEMGHWLGAPDLDDHGAVMFRLIIGHNEVTTADLVAIGLGR